MAAVDLLHGLLPDLKIRVVNVVDLMTLQPKSQHPHGLAEADFDALFTADKSVIVAYHGYPSLIHRLVYRRTNHGNSFVTARTCRRSPTGAGRRGGRARTRARRRRCSERPLWFLRGASSTAAGREAMTTIFGLHSHGDNGLEGRHRSLNDG
jgi:XFP C-terminal domain